MNTRLFSLTFAAIAIFAGNVLAFDATIAVFDIPGLHQKDGNGVYDQVLRKAGKAGNITFSTQVLVPNRALRNFKAGNVDCLSPANNNPEFYSFKFGTIESIQMAIAKIYIFTKSGDKPLSEISSLVGKNVGVRRGMPYGKKIENSGIKLINANSIKANIKKLNAGRIDAFLAYWPNVYTVFDELEMEYLPHTIDQPVAVHEDSVVCRTDNGGKKIIESLNKGFEKIKANGGPDQAIGD